MLSYDHDQDANSRRFFALAKKLDNVLLKYKKNFYIINNPYVHLARNHPEYLNHWKPVIYRTKPTTTEIFQILKNIIFGVFFLLKNVAKELAISKRTDKFFPTTNTHTDFLIISHFLGKKINEYDFYYGNLLIDLTKANKSVVRALIPHVNSMCELPESSLFESSLLNENLPNRIIFDYVFKNLQAIFSISFYGIFRRFTLYEVLVLIYGQLINFSSIKISYNIELLLTTLKPDRVIMTFEGNAIERSIFLLCEKYNITSFGYQHAPIIKDQYSIFRSLGKGLDPDVILASGSYTYNKFLVRFENKVPIICLGSSKSKSLERIISKGKNSSNVLLVPDGNRNSVDEFLNIANKLIDSQSSLNIVLRVHPLLYNYALNIISKSDLERKGIFNLSIDILTIDLEWTYWVIYQNSSIAIEALLEGCEAVHFSHELANVDPLFDLANFRSSVQDFDELVELLTHKPTRTVSDYQQIREFADNYFSSLDSTKLMNFM
jgi:hypothetical protein